MHTLESHRKVGDRIPTVTFRTRTDRDWEDVTTDALFSGRRVIVFSLPGAFTPTCSTNQLPGFDRLAPVFQANGIDEILCISVNDAFVMRRWQEDQQIRNVRMIPDGNGEFTDAMGLLVDKQDLGFGKRSWRYSMLVDDGIIEQIFVEPNVPGDPYEVSSPERMLAYINPNARLPDQIALVTRTGCAYCAMAKELLLDNGLAFEQIPVETAQGLAALTGQKTWPQAYVNGTRIGDSQALTAWLEQRRAA